MRRKSVLAVFVAVMMAGLLTACGGSDGTGQAKSGTQQENVSGVPSQEKADSQENGTEQGGVLIAYFSRYGNTEYPADIDASTSASVVQDGEKRYGTTEYVATIIQKTVGGELYRIEVEEPYSEIF